MQLEMQQFTRNFALVMLPFFAMVFLLANVYIKRSLVSVLALFSYLALSLWGTIAFYNDSEFWGEHAREIPTAMMYGSSVVAVVFILIYILFFMVTSLGKGES